ncbi:alpha-mannosidase [Planctomycetota bacterium]
MAGEIKEPDFERMLRRIELTLQVLRGEFFSNARSVAVSFRKAQTADKPAEIDPRKFGGREIKTGSRWARHQWQRGFFLVSGTVPKEFAGCQAVVRIDVGAEAVAYIDGSPIQGLEKNRDDLVLARNAKGGERFKVLVEAVAVNDFGEAVDAVLKRAEICTFNRDINTFYYDLQVLVSLARSLGRDDPWALKLNYVGNKAVDIWRDEFSSPGPSRRARKAAAVLAELYQYPASKALPEAYLAGHAHIDVAWLWPLAETVRKCSRTFSTVTRYLREYPDFRFSQSQAALYDMTKQNFPSLYGSIKKLIKSGRWETVGGMWVECDCNITGAEAMIRQFLMGKAFFKKEFGTDSDVCWLPDTFGFPASLPQILRQCGINYFATAKIGWNVYTTFPHSTFNWQGIDGSRVLAHIIKSGDYNSHAFPDQVRRGMLDFAQADRSPAYLISFGYGDGGGGPTRGQIERAGRMQNIFGLPKSKMAFISDFFRQVERDSQDLPDHRGELYLEIHRGTLTTQARTKRNNRKAELTLRRLEILLAIMKMLGPAPDFKEEVDALWKTVLTLQFHDILPGSSIAWVYRDADRMYAEFFRKAAVLENKVARKLAHIDNPSKNKTYLVFNCLSWDRAGTVEIPLPANKKSFHAVGHDGESLLCQQVRHEDGSRALLVEVPAVPAMGYTVISLCPGAGDIVSSDLTVRKLTLSNSKITVKLDNRGRIVSLVDTATSVEVLASDSNANLLKLYADEPIRWEAWDIDEDFDRAGTALAASSIEVLESGPVRCTLRTHFEFGSSSLMQDVRLYCHRGWLEFDTHVDWQERRKLLKAEFPTNIDPAVATYDIQFGTVERPTTRNNLSDRAQFECAAHRWTDLSTPQRGVSLLNDCKYGHAVKSGTLALSLLRGTCSPDPKADAGKHRFSYAIYPHKGDWRQGHTVRRGLEFNVPLALYPIKRQQGRPAASTSFVRVNADNIVIESLKIPENGDGIIIRAYEAHGCDILATFTSNVPLRRVLETNALEQAGEEISVAGNHFDVSFKPFAIKTFKVKFNHINSV